MQRETALYSKSGVQMHTALELFKTGNPRRKRTLRPPGDVFLQEILAGDQQVDFFPLGLFVDAVALLHRGEAALGRQGDVAAHHGLGL